MAVEQQNDDRVRHNPYYGIIFGIILVLLLNGLIMPKLVQQKIIDTDYGSFIQMVEEGKVKKVQIEENRVFFSAVTSGNEEQVYQTGCVNDPDLVNRLLNAGSPNETGSIEFTKTIPRESSPLINFLLLWVLPGVIFYLLWRQMSKSIQGRMAGGNNVLSFGKSGAKIYADSDISTTFADVAGQDEAKEALSGWSTSCITPINIPRWGLRYPRGTLGGTSWYRENVDRRAVAGGSKVPFFSISGSEFVQMFVGMGAAKVRPLQTGQREGALYYLYR